MSVVHHIKGFQGTGALGLVMCYCGWSHSCFTVEEGERLFEEHKAQGGAVTGGLHLHGAAAHYSNPPVFKHSHPLRPNPEFHKVCERDDEPQKGS